MDDFEPALPSPKEVTQKSFTINITQQILREEVENPQIDNPEAPKRVRVTKYAGEGHRFYSEELHLFMDTLEPGKIRLDGNEYRKGKTLLDGFPVHREDPADLLKEVKKALGHEDLEYLGEV